MFGWMSREESAKSREREVQRLGPDLDLSSLTRTACLWAASSSTPSTKDLSMSHRSDVFQPASVFSKTSKRSCSSPRTKWILYYDNEHLYLEALDNELCPYLKPRYPDACILSVQPRCRAVDLDCGTSEYTLNRWTQHRDQTRDLG
jgi:hypothetical protein